MAMLDYGKPVHKCKPPILAKGSTWTLDDYRYIIQADGIHVSPEKVYPRAQWQCDTCDAIWNLSASFEWIKSIGDPGPAHKPPKPKWVPTPDVLR